MTHVEGGRKAAKTNKDKYGEDYYARIGAKAGAVKNPNKGFGSATPEMQLEYQRRKAEKYGKDKQSEGQREGVGGF